MTVQDLRGSWPCASCRTGALPRPGMVCHPCEAQAGPPKVCTCKAGDGEDTCPWVEDCYARWCEARGLQLQLVLEDDQYEGRRYGRGVQDVPTRGLF